MSIVKRRTESYQLPGSRVKEREQEIRKENRIMHACHRERTIGLLHLGLDLLGLPDEELDEGAVAAAMAAGGAEARAIIVGRQVQRVLGPLDEAEDDGVLLPGEEAPHRVKPEPRARGHQQQPDRVAEEEEVRVQGVCRHWCCLQREEMSQKKTHRMVRFATQRCRIFILAEKDGQISDRMEGELIGGREWIAGGRLIGQCTVDVTR